MTSCATPDAIAAALEAAEWDVDRLRHIVECERCRAWVAQIASLRTALGETEDLDARAIAAVMGRVRAEAQSTATFVAVPVRWAHRLEAVLAGAAAPLVLVTSGITVQPLVALVLAGTAALAVIATGTSQAQTHAR